MLVVYLIFLKKKHEQFDTNCILKNLKPLDVLLTQLVRAPV